MTINIERKTADSLDIKNLQTIGATATVIYSIPVAEGQSKMVHIEATGAKSDLTAGYASMLWNGFRRAVAGNVTAVGATAGTEIEDSGASPAITITANTVAQTIEIKVAGVAAETWNWKVKISDVILP